MKNKLKQTIVTTNVTISKEVVLEIEKKALSTVDFTDVTALWAKKKNVLNFWMFVRIIVYAIVFIGPLWFLWGSPFIQNRSFSTIVLIIATIVLGLIDWLLLIPIISSIEDGLSKGPTDYLWGKSVFEKIYTLIKVDFGKKRSDLYAGVLSDIFVTSIHLNKALFNDFSVQTANGLFKLDYHWWVLSRINSIFSGKVWDPKAELGFEYNWEWQFVSPIWLNSSVAIKSMALCDGGLIYIELEGDGLPNLPLKEDTSLIRDIEYLESRSYENPE